MTPETTIEKAKAVIEEMRELLAKLEAERAAPRRNWPEKVEAGDCFAYFSDRYVLFGKRLVNIETGVIWATNGDPFGGDEKDFAYLGKLDLAIRTDAHEPTGAELVGKAVHVSDDPNRGWCTESCGRPITIINYNPGSTNPYTTQSGNIWKYARLAR